MLKDFWFSIVGFFKGPKWKKAQEIAKKVGDILPFAENVVEIIAAASGNKTLKEIDNLLRKILAIPPEELPFDPTREYTKLEINGILMGAANYAIRGELNKAIEQAGEAGFIVGGQKLKSASDVPDNIINTALNTTYSFIKKNF
jgi:hypothetical protein